MTCYKRVILRWDFAAAYIYDLMNNENNRNPTEKVTDQQKPSDTQTENFHIHSFTLLYAFFYLYSTNVHTSIYMKILKLI